MNHNVDEVETKSQFLPGAHLKAKRESMGISISEVALKLNLRVSLIEDIEADFYDKMPEPVFIKGYFRAYARLLKTDPDALITALDSVYVPPVKPEITNKLWQPQKRHQKSENIVRIVTALVMIGVLCAVAVWWQQSRDSQKDFKAEMSSVNEGSEIDNELKLTDLSKMQMLSTTKTSPNNGDRK